MDHWWSPISSCYFMFVRGDNWFITTQFIENLRLPSSQSCRSWLRRRSWPTGLVQEVGNGNHYNHRNMSLKMYKGFLVCEFHSSAVWWLKTRLCRKGGWMLQANMTTLRQEEKDLLLDSDCVPGGSRKDMRFSFALPAICSPRLQVILFRSCYWS